MATQLAEVMTKLVELLQDLQSEERAKVVQAALTILGDVGNGKASTGFGTKGETNLAENLSGLPKPAVQWLKKHGVAEDRLLEYFHIEGQTAEAIALPGNATKKSEQVQNTYLVQGIVGLLSNGEAAFADESARLLSEHFGCYDSTNHAKYMKFGNKIAGSKAAGWKLTAPGLSAAALLIKGSPAE
jgi:hypothetical protein